VVGSTFRSSPNGQRKTQGVGRAFLVKGGLGTASLCLARLASQCRAASAGPAAGGQAPKPEGARARARAGLTDRRRSGPLQASAQAEPEIGAVDMLEHAATRIFSDARIMPFRRSAITIEAVQAFATAMALRPRA
jgi:hypothetical protein